MNKTLFALIACTTLVAPSMAEELAITGDYYNAYVPEDGDEVTDHYTLFLLNVTSNDVSAFATTLGALTYDEFQTQYSSKVLATNTATGFVTTTTPNKVKVRFSSSSSVTLNDESITRDNILATWVYDNGKTGDDRVTEFKVAAIGVASGLVKATTNYQSSDWTAFAAKTPEPATATLSLMALAGLAARRRRK